MELVLAGSRPLSTAAFLSGTGPEALVIDASRLEFACPLDLAGVVATAHWAASCAIRVTLRMPTEAGVASYLQRMDVLRQMPARTQIAGRVPLEAGTDKGDVLLQVTSLNRRNVDDLAERVGRLVTSFYRRHAVVGSGAVVQACSELMSNATEHGFSDEGAFIAAQLHTGNTTSGPRLEFAVCDTGIGILQHLRQNPRHAHLTRDEVAIVKALKPGVSGVGDDRGNGLSDAILHASRYGRVEFQLRSGKGEVRVVSTGAQHERRPGTRPDETSGTWAWLTHQWSS